MCRLRSRHARRTRKTSNKRSPLIMLREALEDPSVHPNGRISWAEVCELQGKARELELLMILFDSEVNVPSTSNQSVETLLKLVQKAEAFALTSVGKMITALGTSRTLDPSTKEYLPIAINKLARYSLASRYLVASARKRRYSIFGNIKVETFQIAHPNKPLFQKPFSTLEQALRNVTNHNTSHRGRNSDPLASFPWKCKADMFGTRVTAEDEIWKVHAEIQLLVCYELNPELPKPRIIASSKSACYLCNLFISLHGHFQVPRTHGRVYDRWLLPDWVDFTPQQRNRMNMAAEELNSSIEKTIIDTLNAGRKNHKHPNESVLFHVRQPSSSTFSAAQLATPLPTPHGSQISFHTPIMQRSSSDAISIRTSIPRIHAIAEDQSLDHLKPVPASPVDGTSSKQPGPASTSSVESTERASSILGRIDSEYQDVENESDYVVKNAEAEPSAAEAQPTSTSTPSLLSTSHPSSKHSTPHHSRRTNSADSISKALTKPGVTSTTSLARYAVTSQYSLSHPSQAHSYRFSPQTKEIHIQAGKLHLNLTTEIPPHLDAQHSRECTVNVKFFPEQDHRQLASFTPPQEIIDARDIPPGEAVTVDRGSYLSKDELLLSCGLGTVVSIRYGLEGLQT